jgi:hypothetical protein
MHVNGPLGPPAFSKNSEPAAITTFSRSQPSVTHFALTIILPPQAMRFLLDTAISTGYAYIDFGVILTSARGFCQSIPAQVTRTSGATFQLSSLMILNPR